MDFVECLLKETKFRDDAILDHNGRPVCPVCGDPVTAFHKFLGVEREVPIACTCVRNRWKEAEEKQRTIRINQNVSRCFSGTMDMRKYSFDMDDGQDPHTADVCRKYADNFKKMLDMSEGLLMMGGPGTGKSFFAACVANKLLDDGYTVRFLNAATLANAMYTVEDKTEYIKGECGCSLLIIDDLGAERKGPFATECMYSLVNERYLTGLPMIITTNLTGSELKGQEMALQRIYDRIVQRCYPVMVNGQNRRKLEAVERKNELDKFFRGE